MSDEPPPMDIEEEETQEKQVKEDKEDEQDDDNIFGTPETEKKEVKQEEEEEIVTKPVTQLPEKTTEDEKLDDLFDEPLEPFKPVETERPHTDSEPPTLEPSIPEPKPQTIPVPDPVPPPSVTQDLFDDDEEEPKSKTGEQLSPPVELNKEEEEEEEEEEEDDDEFEMTITVSAPEKVGDGMSAYMTYLVTTKTTLPSFKSPEFYVRRRFSDFLGLYYRLSEKYVQLGRIVPPAPEKSVTGMTKIKFSKSEEGGAAFIERRRANLERYLSRLAKHPVIKKDEELQNFLENPGELPKAKETAAMSGAGFMRLVKNVGESISKMAGKKSDSDKWFDDRQQEYDVLEYHLKKLLNAVESLIIARRELCTSSGAVVKSVATLANVEENNSLSRALTRLSEVEERVEGLHQEQSNKDLYVFAETIRDYVMLLGSIKGNFTQRIKVYNNWMSAQKTLQNKRDTEAKLTATGKMDKLPLVQDEIHDWTKKEKDGEKAFNKCCKVLRREIERFETERSKEFKEKFIEHLEALMHMQEELVRVWEEYLPDAQAIDAEA